MDHLCVRILNALSYFLLLGSFNSGKVYNIGNGHTITVLQLIQNLNEILGTHLDPIHGPARAGDVRHSQADITLARTDLGYEPSVAFAEGLRRTVESLRA